MGAALVGGSGFCARRFVALDDDGIEWGVDAFDPRNVRLDSLHRGDLAAHQFRDERCCAAGTDVC